MASVVTRRPATELASCKATLTTLAGSMMPFPIKSPYSPVCASNPNDGDLWSVTLPTTIEPSTPAFSAIWRIGACSARRMMLTPASWSSLSPLAFRDFAAHSSATPPPGTMPSSTAARVAFSASSTRSFLSFTSSSLEPPTLITATPPASLAKRSCSFSLS
jgi:hypothetical protein